MKQIGITETFDPCFVPDWETKLLDANIIISKELTDEMIEKLLIVQDKVIFHHTVTGFGGTEFEPGVKLPEVEFVQFKKLIERGFPLSHYVLRVDPILCFSESHMKTVLVVLDMWKSYLITQDTTLRCRISIVDIYDHVRQRLKDEANFEVPWQGFHAPKVVFDHVINSLKPYTDIFDFEACAETQQRMPSDFIHYCGCASYADLMLLDKEISEYGYPEKGQRKECMCLAKKQILGVKPGRCQHRCAYCFWK